MGSILGVVFTVLLIILYILAAIAGIILLAVIFVLFCKISYRIYAAKAGLDEPFKYEASVSVLWGIFKYKLGSDDGNDVKVPKFLDKKNPSEKAERTDVFPEENTKQPAFEEKKTDDERISSKIRGFQNIRNNLKDAEIGKIIRYTLAYIKKLYKVVKPKKFFVKGRYGAEDPDHTGLVLAALWSVAGMTGMNLNVEGDFENEVLEFEIVAAGHLRTWFIVLPTLRYITKREIRRVIFAKRIKKKADKKKKKMKAKRKDVLNGHRI